MMVNLLINMDINHPVQNWYWTRSTQLDMNPLTNWLKSII